MSNKPDQPSSLACLANEYGNVDVRYSLRAGFVWIDEPRAAAKARALEIVHLPALVGFERVRERYFPALRGIVVKVEDEARLREALVPKRRSTPEQKEKRKQARQRKDVESFEARILAEFPACPSETARAIAVEATEIGSGRVGRSTQADDPVRAAVVAWIRHNRTEYDEIIGEVGRDEARRAVAHEIRETLDAWSNKAP